MREFFLVSHTSDLCLVDVMFVYDIPIFSLPPAVKWTWCWSLLTVFPRSPGSRLLTMKTLSISTYIHIFSIKENKHKFSPLLFDEYLPARRSILLPSVLPAETDGYIHVSETAAVGTWNHISCSYEQRTDDDDVDAAPLVCATFFFILLLPSHHYSPRSAVACLRMFVQNWAGGEEESKKQFKHKLLETLQSQSSQAVAHRAPAQVRADWTLHSLVATFV